MFAAKSKLQRVAIRGQQSPLIQNNLFIESTKPLVEAPAMKAVGEALKKAAGKPVPVPVPGPSEPSIEKPGGILPEIWLGFPDNSIPDRNGTQYP